MQTIFFLRYIHSTYWPFTPTRVYSVKSGYWFLTQTQSMESAVDQVEVRNIWRKVWGLFVPNKFRNFLWRAINNSIPSKVNVIRCKVIYEDVCDHCKAGSEDVIDALWVCTHLASVWESHASKLEFSSQYPLLEFQRTDEVCDYGGERQFFATTIRIIWYRCNSLRIGSKPFTVGQIVPDVFVAQASFFKAIPPKPPDIFPRVPQSVIWKPTPSTFFKVNYDGAVFRYENPADIGVVIMDANGLFVASMAEKIYLPSMVTFVEALATIKALSLAHDIGLSAIVLEGDSEVIINALKNYAPPLTAYGHLIGEAQSLTQTFAAIDFLHIRCQGNSVTHNIARHISEFMVWMKDVPPRLHKQNQPIWKLLLNKNYNLLLKKENYSLVSLF